MAASRKATAAVTLCAFLLVSATSCASREPAPTSSRTSTSNEIARRAPLPVDPPRIPNDFSWEGRYVVPDLDVDVPFTWVGAAGDFQMVAGGPGEKIHFTNVIADGELYTLTYEWPGIPRQPCSHVGPFTVAELNEGFANSSFVGEETLHGDPSRRVNHFRSVGVLDVPPEMLEGDGDIPVRIPLMAGDIYTDVDDPEQLWKLLHFGLQNLYDPDLDEWIVIERTLPDPGEVSLPSECGEGAD